ncbi:hypothetical protein M0804_010625 [Polistes exclamans]|nr:hypothetical protein M0804_010625 [Polistes exclamans]
MIEWRRRGRGRRRTRWVSCRQGGEIDNQGQTGGEPGMLTNQSCRYRLCNIDARARRVSDMRRVGWLVGLYRRWTSFREKEEGGGQLDRTSLVGIQCLGNYLDPI